MTSRRIELHIEELVLHGFSASDKHRIGDAVRQELVRLVSEQRGASLARFAGDHERVTGGKVRLEQDAPPEMMGAQIAQAVLGGLRGRR